MLLISDVMTSPVVVLVAGTVGLIDPGGHLSNQGIKSIRGTSLGARPDLEDISM